MAHDHDHHNHADMVTKVNVVTNHAQDIIQQQAKSDHSGHGSATNMMMSMTFHGGFQEQILFNQWNTQTVGAFVGSWFVIFFVAVLYEGLKTVRDHLAKREARRHYIEKHNQQAPLVIHADQHYEPPNNNEMLPGVRTDHVRSKRARLLSGQHIIQTALHILQMGISYLLMLIAMTFNIYLFLAIILGAGLGHFLFGWRRSSIIDYNEHCH